MPQLPLEIWQNIVKLLQPIDAKSVMNAKKAFKSLPLKDQEAEANLWGAIVRKSVWAQEILKYELSLGLINPNSRYRVLMLSGTWQNRVHNEDLINEFEDSLQRKGFKHYDKVRMEIHYENYTLNIMHILQPLSQIEVPTLFDLSKEVVYYNEPNGPLHTMRPSEVRVGNFWVKRLRSRKDPSPLILYSEFNQEMRSNGSYSEPEILFDKLIHNKKKLQ